MCLYIYICKHIIVANHIIIDIYIYILYIYILLILIMTSINPIKLNKWWCRYLVGQSVWPRLPYQLCATDDLTPSGEAGEGRIPNEPQEMNVNFGWTLVKVCKLFVYDWEDMLKKKESPMNWRKFVWWFWTVLDAPSSRSAWTINIAVSTYQQGSSIRSR